MGPREFGAWLKDQRGRLKRDGRIATQDEIGRRAGVSRSMVAMIEAMAQPHAKVFDPSREIVEKLARAVDASVSEALVIAGYAPPEMPAPDDWPTDVVELAEDIRRLPRSEFEFVRTFVQKLAPSDQLALAV